MYLFIDNNTFLSYFGFDSRIDSLLQLQKLLKNKSRKLTLLVTDQTLREFERNIGNRIYKNNKQINDEKINISTDTPKNNQELNEEIQERMKQINTLIKTHKDKKLKKYKTEVINREKLIKEILKLGQHINCTSEIYEKAKIRHFVGNPPKKPNDNSFGDAINWESLLTIAKADASDLAIISSDPDYAEDAFDGKKINRLLKEEWRKKYNKKVTLFISLGDFLTSFDRKIKIKEDVINEEKEASTTYAQGILTAPWSGLSGVLNVTPTQSSLISTTIGSGGTVPFFTMTTNENNQIKCCPFCKKDINTVDIASSAVYPYQPFAYTTSGIFQQDKIIKCPHCGKTFKV